MKPRLILTVLLLVVLPTAVLTFLAHEALRTRELVLQFRLQREAGNAVQAVSLRLQGRLDDDMEQVTAVMSECLSRGAKAGDFREAARRLRQARGTVKALFLYLHPWGFLYPEEERGQKSEVRGQTAGDEGQGRDQRERGRNADVESQARPPGSGLAASEAVVTALRREITLAGSGRALRFMADNAAFCFLEIPGRKGFYAGFEVDTRELADEVRALVGGASGGGFTLEAEGPGLNEPGDVTISDSFGETAPAGGRRTVVLASGRLLRPFDYIRVSAVAEDPDRAPPGTEFRLRLYAWGVLLLAAFIGAGVWMTLRQAYGEITRARSRSDFVIGVSHDLRTPVSSMKMLAESLYLEHVSRPEKRKQFLGVIIRECERLSRLVEKVLFFVRLDQEALVYRRKETDIGAVTARAVETFEAGSRDCDACLAARETDREEDPATPGGRAQDPGLRREKKPGEPPGDERPTTPEKIRVRIEPGLPPVMADEGAITQVVLNLLDNAWKYSGSVKRAAGSEGESRRVQVTGQETEAGGMRSAEHRKPDVECRRPVVTVRCEAVARRGVFGGRRRWVRISVEDEGIGIERKEWKKIFRRFYRVPSAWDSNVSGVGLGLFLCRHVVRAHGGRIAVHSEPGKGSTFSVYLPASGRDVKRGT